MNIKKVHLIYFSPTHTSRRVGEAIVRGIGLDKLEVSDLTCAAADFQETSADTLTVVALPVYGGHLPQLAVLRMGDLRAAGAPAVAVVVYGNRAYDKSLGELDTFLTGKGFRVMAAATFVGEHSYSTASYPIAAGRPNQADLDEATDFGRKIRQKLEKQTADAGLPPAVDVSRIRRPRQPFFPLLRFIYGFIRLQKSGQPMPVTPTVDESLCIHCGSCVKTCPNGAIAAGDECHTMADRCIRCCACVKGCPQKARRFETPFSALLSKNFKQQKQNETIL